MQDPKIINSPSTKTSTDTDGPNDTGESSVQEGENIVNQEDQSIVVNEEESQEEFINNDLNNGSVPTDAVPEHRQCLVLNAEDEDEDDDDEDDDDDDDEVVIGDDPAETKRKIPVM